MGAGGLSSLQGLNLARIIAELLREDDNMVIEDDSCHIFDEPSCFLYSEPIGLMLVCEMIVSKSTCFSLPNK